MTRFFSFFKALFYLLIVTIGIYIMFIVTWANNGAGFFGILGFFLIGFGALYAANSLTRLFIPFNVDFNVKIMSNKISYQELKNKIGKTKMTVINSLNITFFFTIFIVSFYCYFKITDTYKDEQLAQHGERQKVLINKTGYKGKGSSKAFFDFYYNNKKYSDNLTQDDLEVGDSATIIFSKQNPDIVIWEKDYGK